MSLFEVAIIIVIIYLCVYSIVDRICKCVEQKRVANAFTDMMGKFKDPEEM